MNTLRRLQVVSIALFLSGAVACTAQAALPSSTGHKLTLQQAERIALEHNPTISVAHLLALAQAQVTREARAGELPDASANLTAVGTHDNSRITAGALNNPIVYDRAAAGLTVRQLITDFGRTHNLIRNAQSNAKASLMANAPRLKTSPSPWTHDGVRGRDRHPGRVVLAQRGHAVRDDPLVHQRPGRIMQQHPGSSGGLGGVRPPRRQQSVTFLARGDRAQRDPGRLRPGLPALDDRRHLAVATP